jgi:hypothetical protein
MLTLVNSLHVHSGELVHAEADEKKTKMAGWKNNLKSGYDGRFYIFRKILYLNTYPHKSHSDSHEKQTKRDCKYSYHDCHRQTRRRAILARISPQFVSRCLFFFSIISFCFLRSLSLFSSQDFTSSRMHAYIHTVTMKFVNW